jgi:hypothetical protein
VQIEDIIPDKDNQDHKLRIINDFRSNMGKKAQIKMFETIAVLIVFFFMLIFGLVYYNSTQTREIKRMIEDDKQLRAIEIMKTATYLPELQCSIDNVLTSNCLDKVKLESFADVSDTNRLYYANFFSFGRIYVNETYPEQWGKVIFLNDKTTNKNKITNFIPILIYDPIDRKYAAGVLVVEVLT